MWFVILFCNYILLGYLLLYVCLYVCIQDTTEDQHCLLMWLILFKHLNYNYNYNMLAHIIINRGRPIISTKVLANLRTGLDLRTNTSTHFTWPSPRFIPVVLISGLVFAKTRSPSLALKRLLSYVIAWDTTCIYQQFNTQQFPIPLISL